MSPSVRPSPPRAARVRLGAAALAEPLGHLRLPAGRLVPACLCVLLLYAQVNAILIFLSVLKASGRGAFTAKAEFCTLCSILMEKTQITAQLHKGFCFWLCGTCWLSLQEGAQRIFSFLFFSLISPTSMESPSLVTFPHPGKNVSLFVLAGRLHSFCPD